MKPKSFAAPTSSFAQSVRNSVLVLDVLNNGNAATTDGQTFDLSLERGKHALNLNVSQSVGGMFSPFDDLRFGNP